MNNSCARKKPHAKKENPLCNGASLWIHALFLSHKEAAEQNKGILVCAIGPPELPGCNPRMLFKYTDEIFGLVADFFGNVRNGQIRCPQ